MRTAGRLRPGITPGSAFLCCLFGETEAWSRHLCASSPSRVVCSAGTVEINAQCLRQIPQPARERIPFGEENVVEALLGSKPHSRCGGPFASHAANDGWIAWTADAARAPFS